MKSFTILSTFVALLFFSACAPEPYIEVNQTDFQMGYEGGKILVIVKSNYVWTASSINSDVVTIEPNFGASGDTAAIIVSPNLDGISKELLVMFSCTSSKTYSKQNVIITQGFAQPIISAEASTDEIPYSRSNVSIVITSNFIWTSSFDKNLVSLSKTTGNSGKDTVIATIYENRSEESILHQIDFICSSTALSDTSTVSINQGVAPAPSISVDPRHKSISAAGGEFSASITSKYEWTASASEGIELSSGIGEGDDTITITVPENTSASSKEYFVIFYSSIRQEMVSDTLLIEQAGK